VSTSIATSSWTIVALSTSIAIVVHVHRDVDAVVPCGEQGDLAALPDPAPATWYGVRPAPCGTGAGSQGQGMDPRTGPIVALRPSQRLVVTRFARFGPPQWRGAPLHERADRLPGPPESGLPGRAAAGRGGGRTSTHRIASRPARPGDQADPRQAGGSSHQRSPGGCAGHPHSQRRP
jgi:hypothetical protein